MKSAHELRDLAKDDEVKKKILTDANSVKKKESHN